MKSANRFSGTVISDLDYSDIKPNQMVYPTLNIRIFNKDGQGWIATPIKGDKYEDGVVGFKLSNGFSYLGSVEHNGIVYIVSKNADDKIEIGSYPSPKQAIISEFGYLDYLDDSLSGFERVYKPLANLENTLGNRMEFRTDKINIDPTKRLDIIARSIYDDSVNLYICNGINPNIIINTSFNNDGIYNEFLYKADDFNGTIDLIPSPTVYPNITDHVVENGGDLEPGNYYVYFRYINEKFSSTPFIASRGPINVFTGSTNYDIEGLQEKDWQLNASNKTTKRIVLSFDTALIDGNFKYIQIGIVRFSAETENGLATENIYAISKLYNSEDIKRSGEIIIRGNEVTEVLTIEELFRNALLYNVSKNHIPIGNRYLGSNYRSTVNYDKNVHEALKLFAQKVTSSISYRPNLPDNGTLDFAASGTIYGFKNQSAYVDNIGFFPGEIYPWAIRFVFRGGFMSSAYPVRSSDYLTAQSFNSEQIAKGLIRMPSPSANNLEKILKITFDTTDAVADIDEDLFEDVIGYMFVRGERIENLLCQGVLFPTYKGMISDAGKTYYFDGGSGSNESNAYRIPMIASGDPSNAINNVAWTLYDEGNDDYYYQSGEGIQDKQRFALFAPDYFFKNLGILDDGQYHLELMSKFTVNRYYHDDGEHIPDRKYLSHKITEDWTTEEDIFEIDAYNVNQGITRSSNRFVSWLKDGQGLSDHGFNSDDVTTYDRAWNRSIFSPKYIGIQLKGNDSITAENDVYLIANLYRNVNNAQYMLDELASFEPSLTEYYPVSNVLPINQGYAKTFGNGDCFVQRNWFRPTRHYDLDNNPDEWDDNTPQKTRKHGILFSAYLKTAVNANMRNDVSFYNSDNLLQKYSYFPKILDAGNSLEQWLDSEEDKDRIEAFQLNDGYNKMENPLSSLGFDDKTMIFDPVKQFRVYFSNPLIAGSIIDQFSEIDSNNFIDLPLQGKEIIDIIAYNEKLLGITKDFLFQIFYDERTTQTDEQGNTVLAETSTFISDRIQIIAEFGSQHKDSIIKTKFGIYGFDWNKRIIWRVGTKTSEISGRGYLKAEDLTLLKFNQKKVRDILSEFDSYTDILSTPDDDSLNGTGVVSSYDSENDEVIMTILFEDLQVSGLRHDTSIVFSEIQDGFVGERAIVSPVTIRINNDLYTSGVDYTNGFKLTTNFYKNGEGDYLTIHDEIQSFKLSFIVNGQDNEKSLSAFEKIFEALEIEMGDDLLTKIIYQTEYQQSDYDFQTEDDSIKPEYMGYRWDVPITVQTQSLNGGSMENESEMSGTWLKVTLVYEPESDPQGIYIKKVITNFTLLNE